MERNRKEGNLKEKVKNKGIENVEEDKGGAGWMYSESFLITDT